MGSEMCIRDSYKVYTRRLEVVVVTGQPWISWCVFGSAGFRFFLRLLLLAHAACRQYESALPHLPLYWYHPSWRFCEERYERYTSRLDVVAVTGLLWISLCSFVRQDSVFFFFVRFFGSTRPADSMMPPCPIYLSTSTTPRRGFVRRGRLI